MQLAKCSLGGPFAVARFRSLSLAGLGGAAGRLTGMLRMSIGELYCTSPLAGSTRVEWYCSPAPVVQTARVKCSIESQCSTKLIITLLAYIKTM